MTDLIERDKAIEAILDLHADHRVSWKDAVIDVLETLPLAQPEPQWISCSERLPEIGEMVLATTKWNTVTIVRNMELCWEMCGQGFGGHYGDIIAWMPLPEPWRGEQDG